MSLLRSFCIVGALAFIVNWATFNIIELLCRASFNHPFPMVATVAANAMALIVSYYGNRKYTFGGKSSSYAGVRFVLINLLAAIVQYLCIVAAHKIFEEDSTLIDNLASYLIGLPLGLLIRLFLYKRWVFLE